MEEDWEVLVCEEPLFVDRDLGLNLKLGREGVDWGWVLEVADDFDFGFDLTLSNEDKEEDFCLCVGRDVGGDNAVNIS